MFFNSLYKMLPSSHIIILPGYSGSYHKKSGDKRDGCATLWKKDRFHLLRATPVDYCRGGLLDRDNIALIVELQPIRDDCEQAVCSSLHFSVLHG